MAVIDDLTYALPKLIDKQSEEQKYWNYYDGDTPMVYSTAAMRKQFGSKIDFQPRLNWCSVVVNAMADRINLEGFTVDGDEPATKALKEIVDNLSLCVDADDATNSTIICGEGFMIAGKNPETDEIEVYENNPKLLYAVYKEARPKELDYVLKLVRTRDFKFQAVLYYEDVIVTLWTDSNKNRQACDLKPDHFKHQTEEQNTYGRIPVFHFQRSRRRLQSELHDVIQPQDAVNKLFADGLIASDAASLGQRYVVSNVDNLATSLQTGQKLWTIPAADKDSEPTQIGAFPSAEITGFWDSIKGIVESVSAITRTPRHLFFGSTGTPSGEALIAMEAPLVQKCEDFIERVSPTWSELGAFLLSLQGVAVEPAKIEPKFKKPETVQPRTEAEILQINTSAGMPLVTALKEDGWTQDKIDDMLKERASDQEQQSRLAQLTKVRTNAKANADAAPTGS